MPEGNIPGTLGELLRQARQQRGLTIAEIAATTRLPARLLEALERDDLYALPGGMYLRADVLAYADAVHLDREVALDYLRAVIDPPVTPATNQPPPDAARRRPAAGWLVAAAAAAIVLVATLVEWRVQPAWEPPADDEPAAQARVPIDTPSPSATTGIALPTAVRTAVVTTAGPSPARATPVVDAEVEIVTEPAGARVTVDGVGWGVTPVTIKYLPPGTKRLRITRDGFVTEDRVIRVTEDRPRTVVQIALRASE